MKAKDLILPVCMLSIAACTSDETAVVPPEDETEQPTPKPEDPTPDPEPEDPTPDPEPLPVVQPNFVIMIADDCSHYDWGVYGRAYAQQYGNRYGNTEAGITPNIDQFATEAMKFNRCYQQAPTSSPTRHALYTGLHSVRSGAYPNHTYAYDHVQSFVNYFRPAGYRTALAWKQHVQPKSVFDYEYIGSEGGDKLNYDGDKYKGMKTLISECKASETPFFLVVASNEPHEPYNLGDPSKWNPNSINIPEGYPDTPETREMLCRYYAEINVFDGQVGNVLRMLKEYGVEENTVVMLLSEQGNSMPFAKWTCYRNGLQSAMLVRWPGHIQPGSETDAIVNYIDVVPTFMDIAGLPAPNTDGKSFYKVLKGETNEHAKYSFGQQTSRGINSGPEYYGIRSVKDGQYNYIWNFTPEAQFKNTTTGGNKAYKSWKTKGEAGDAFALERYNKYKTRPGEELYDMEADPWELKNLANDPAYAAKKAELKAALEAWMADVGDKGQETEMNALNRLWKNAGNQDSNSPDEEEYVVPEGPAVGWVKVTEDKSDWSGTYMVVYDGKNPPYKAWDLTTTASEQENIKVYPNSSKAIVRAETSTGIDIPLEELDNYTITIAKMEDGYSICTARGDYIYNKTGGNSPAAGTAVSETPIVGAHSIALNAALQVEMLRNNTTRFSYYQANDAFNFLPESAYAKGDRYFVSLYEYKSGE